MSEHFTIRPWASQDVDFVMANWLNSWRKSKYAGVVRNNDYYTTQRAVIEDLIGRGAVVLVADAGSTLLGFTCGEVKGGVCVHHYTFVKDIYHGHLTAPQLMQSLPGSKPGYFTYYQPHFAKDRSWTWAREIACRKHL